MGEIKTTRQSERPYRACAEINYGLGLSGEREFRNRVCDCIEKAAVAGLEAMRSRLTTTILPTVRNKITVLSMVTRPGVLKPPH
jgi:hypothetical protein